MTDLIDRQELRKVLLDRVAKLDHEYDVPFTNFDYMQGRMDECNFVEDCILARMPTVEPKKSKWMWDEENHVWYCYDCFRNPTRGMGCIQSQQNLYNFCPHCGADMRGDNNG